MGTRRNSKGKPILHDKIRERTDALLEMHGFLREIQRSSYASAPADPKKRGETIRRGKKKGMITFARKSEGLRRRQRYRQRAEKKKGREKTTEGEPECQRDRE